MRRLKVKPITVQVHPNLYMKMEEIRNQYKQNDISLSQIQLTDLISKRIKTPRINLLRIKNAKKK